MNQTKKTIHNCPLCESKLNIKKLECSGCGVAFEGNFHSSPIMALQLDEQSFLELFIITGGNLREMAKMLGVTYPTLRVHLDHIIGDLKEKMKEGMEERKAVLGKKYGSKLNPEMIDQAVNNND